MERNEGDDSRKWSEMSVEDFEMVDGNGSFGSECTHGCGMRVKRRNPIGDVT